MAKLSFSSPDRSWVKRRITAKLLVFDFLGMIPNKSDFANRTTRFDVPLSSQKIFDLFEINFDGNLRVLNFDPFIFHIYLFG